MTRFHREHWRPGDRAWFEYHCWESPHSQDAPAWYRSHQPVVVLGESDHDGHGSAMVERFENATFKVYVVQFPDGLTWDVFEEELMTSPEGFYRPDPPRKATT